MNNLFSGSLKDNNEKPFSIIITHCPAFVCTCPHCGRAFGVTLTAGGDWLIIVGSGKSVVVCFASNMVFICGKTTVWP
ncbi:MAG: hypothetical protein IIU35_03715, partial [Neisseriaceae bacterium]|nr:hypothetical protein [Neisseriaceae bacterium]